MRNVLYCGFLKVKWLYAHIRKYEAFCFGNQHFICSFHGCTLKLVNKVPSPHHFIIQKYQIQLFKIYLAWIHLNENLKGSGKLRIY